MDIKSKVEKWAQESLQKEDITLVHPKYLANGDFTLIVNDSTAAADFKKLNENKIEEIEKIEFIKPRFINFYLSRKYFAESIENILNTKNFGNNDLNKGKKIMVEYTDPNPFKPFHIGHLMTNAIGESIARILESSGAKVSRANYQGDVGLHVAKAIWVLKKEKTLPREIVIEKIALAYVEGSKSYEDAEEESVIKNEVEDINKKIYDKSNKEVNEIYDWGFKVTMEAFEEIYKTLGTQFDYYFLESKAAPQGEQIVRDNIGKVFEISDDAVVFKAENFDPKLHTRVFITSKGLPTYETKELGLTQEKFEVEPDMNLSLVITANEQADYMRVVYKALSLIHPNYESKMKHLTHGMMRLAGGKMSSRKGNVVTGESLIRDTVDLVRKKIKEGDLSEEEKDKIAEAVGVAAIKYSILRSKAGSDIVYDVEESISVEGDSGPYLQYSFARANSIIEKAQKENILPDFSYPPKEISEVEKLLYRFPEFVSRSASLYEPHHIATYLVEIARAFNSYYGNTQIVDSKDKTSAYKIALTYAFCFVMKKGLHLLGIVAPDKM